MRSTKFWTSSAFVLLAFYLLFGGNRGLWNLYKLHQEKRELVQQVSQLKGEIDRSQLDYRVYKTNPVVMEKQAREELNLVKTGEIVYKFSGSGD